MSYKSSYTGAEIDAAVGKAATSSTDNAIVRFNGTAGQMQDSSVTIDDSGNVGIGTDSPSFVLDVNGTGILGRFGNSTVGCTAGTYLDNALWGFANNGGSQGLFGSDASTYIYLATNGAERIRIDSSGHVIAPYGITLGTAVGTYNAANTLDDYEEGTWTPYLNGDIGGAFAGSTAGSGKYTKIGNTVICTGKVTWTANGTNGALRLYGLPFTSSSSSDEIPNCSVGYDWINSAVFDSYYVNYGTTHALFRLNTAVANASGMPTSGSMYLTFFYRV